MDTHAKKMRTLAIIAAAMLLPAGAQGQGSGSDSAPRGGLGAEWQPVDPARLAQMRGGFQLPSGMMLSFGIERVVYVNGELTARIAVQIPDVRSITDQQAQSLAEFNRGVVVQVGEGNRFDPAGIAGGVVIQNTLDNQDINTATRVNVGVDTLGTFQDLNANGALTDALIRAPGGP
ncbi:hypothetical protein OVA13_04665 [Pseudoxanthomonas sp. SL93]|jgi:hypothetical protein|uniref:hypothetical protein n=1 Tax=Pseudoxanthomonas sp. SL93 TaxID=2995142 RepID=UPI0022712BAF|nr:hypothetical protein [Pseudoxanthomonas sp. SL93]WAC64079.1 hypothetical protein OVA13_04665 [Pseudoxanthomonas sp. SL93]